MGPDQPDTATLFAVGQQTLPSLLAGTINATTPLMTLLVVLVALPHPEGRGDAQAGPASAAPAYPGLRSRTGWRGGKRPREEPLDLAETGDELQPHSRPSERPRSRGT